MRDVPRPFHYIGVDPGLVTAVMFLPPDGVQELHCGSMLPMCDVIDTHLFELTKAVYQKAAEEGHARKPNVVIAVERFTMGGSVVSHQPDALEMIGALRWIARVHDAILVVQGAADASRPGAQDNLKTLGWWTPNDPDQHHNKAAAQVALAMMNHEPQRWHKLLRRSRTGEPSDTESAHQG